MTGDPLEESRALIEDLNDPVVLAEQLAARAHEALHLVGSQHEPFRLEREPDGRQYFPYRMCTTKHTVKLQTDFS